MKQFYALLGLSEPKIYDSTIGAYVPFKLSEAEYDYLEEQIGEKLPEVIHEAREYFGNNYPSGKIYYKRSRWTATAKLYALNVNEALEQVGCRGGSRFDKSQNISQTVKYSQNPTKPFIE